MSSTVDWAEVDSKANFDDRSKTLKPIIDKALELKLLNEETDCHLIDVYNLDAFDERIDDLLRAFPEKHILHAFAVKSQPLAGILKHAVSKYPQIGLECASFGEAWLAHEIGTESSHIVYDSPVKTRQELEKSIKHGFHINIDNVSEMEMIDEILKKPGVETKATFGLRINPLVGEGGLAMSSTAGKGSKFGLIYCEETLEGLVKVYKRYPWLQGVHCHVGSQGCSLDLLSNGAITILRAAEALNKALGKQQVNILDIGGGVPTSYISEQEAVSFSKYREAIQAKVPEFFDGKYRIITEFGRSVFTKYGVTLTRISSVKGSDVGSEDDFDRLRGKNNLNRILLTHVGSNAFLREAYQIASKAWRRRFTVFDKDGNPNVSSADDFCMYDVAGPLCFQGDYIAKDISLPKNINKDDILVMHDTGGYTYALYSHYNSRSPHDVYTVQKGEGGELKFNNIRPRSSLEETIAFWNYEQFKN